MFSWDPRTVFSDTYPAGLTPVHTAVILVSVTFRVNPVFSLLKNRRRKPVPCTNGQVPTVLTSLDEWE